MKNAREALALASIVIAYLINALMYTLNIWRNTDIPFIIYSWSVIPIMTGYCIYKFLKLIALGGRTWKK